MRIRNRFLSPKNLKKKTLLHGKMKKPENCFCLRFKTLRKFWDQKHPATFGARAQSLVWHSGIYCFGHVETTYCLLRTMEALNPPTPPPSRLA